MLLVFYREAGLGTFGLYGFTTLLMAVGGGRLLGLLVCCKGGLFYDVC